MQASYTITGDSGLHAIAQLEGRIRHDSQDAGPAAAALLTGIAGYVRGAVEGKNEPIIVEIDVVIRARAVRGGIASHLAPADEPVAEGNPAPATDSEGGETDSGGAS